MTTVIADLQYTIHAHIAELQTSLSKYMTFHQHQKKTKIIYQPAPGYNEEPPDINTYGTTLEMSEHFPWFGSHLSQKATMEAEIQHRYILYHHILQGLRNQVFNTHNLMEETKVVVYKAVIISMSSEDHEEIPPKLSQKDSL